MSPSLSDFYSSSFQTPSASMSEKQALPPYEPPTIRFFSFDLPDTLSNPLSWGGEGSDNDYEYL